MSWHRTLLGVIAWIVILAPILPVSPMANLAGPLPSSLLSHTSHSSIAHRLLNLESVLHPSSLGHKVFYFNTPPPNQSFTIASPFHSTKESASRPAPIRHGVSHVLHGTKPPTLWSQAGGCTRQALWRARLKVVTPVLDKIVHPSTTGTGKADVAPTSTWTITNPAPARAAPGYARGRSYAGGFKSHSTSSAFPSVFDVGKAVWNWIVFAGAGLLLTIEVMVDYTDRWPQQLVSFSFDSFAGSVVLLSDTANRILSILNKLPRTSDELSTTWSSFAAGQKFVEENWPTSQKLLLVVITLPSTCNSFARRIISDTLAAAGSPPQGYPSWPTVRIWILKKFFVFFHLLALVVLWSAWTLYSLLDSYGPSFEWRLLPLIDFDPRLVGRQVRRMMQPRHWNVQDLVMYFLVQRARQAEADRRRRYEPEPSDSEGSEWAFEDDGPFSTNGDSSSPFDVPAWAAEVEPAVSVEA